jgi:hypothetical protein
LPHGMGEQEAAPSLTFQDRDNRVKINSQAPVAALACCFSRFTVLISICFGDRKVPFRSPLGLPLPSSGHGGGSVGGWFTIVHTCSFNPGESHDPPVSCRLLCKLPFARVWQMSEAGTWGVHFSYGEKTKGSSKDEMVQLKSPS